MVQICTIGTVTVKQEIKTTSLMTRIYFGQFKEKHIKELESHIISTLMKAGNTIDEQKETINKQRKEIATLKTNAFQNQKASNKDGKQATLQKGSKGSNTLETNSQEDPVLRQREHL